MVVMVPTAAVFCVTVAVFRVVVIVTGMVLVVARGIGVCRCVARGVAVNAVG